MAQGEKQFTVAEFRCSNSNCDHAPQITTVAYLAYEGSACLRCEVGTLRAVRLVGVRLRGEEKVA